MANYDIEYITGGFELIKSVEKLWSELNQLHKEKSKYFKEHFNKLSFDSRKESFKDSNKEIFVVIVNNKKIKECIGYSVCSLNDDLVAEIESIYVKPEYHGNSVGKKLMELSLSWLEKGSPNRQEIRVAAGNEEVFEFYSKFGFQPRVTILEKIMTEK